MSRKRVAVTGAGGRLGTAMVRNYGEAYEVIPLGRADLDLDQPEAIAPLLENVEFDCLINCGALTNVDYCETHEEEAFRVNAESVETLAMVCADKGARLIHVSTDYVFDGKEPGLRKETDPALPVSVYGRSKKEGEDKMLAVSPQFLAVRVSWVFGPERPSFIDMIAARAMKEEVVEAIGDKWSSPAYTEDLADWMELLMFEHPKGGLMHLCNQGETTWSEYGEFALKCLTQAGVPLKTQEVGEIPLQSMQNFIAERPVHTAMDTQLFVNVTGVQPRPWEEAVRDYVRDWLAKRLIG